MTLSLNQGDILERPSQLDETGHGGSEVARTTRSQSMVRRGRDQSWRERIHWGDMVE